MAQLRLIALALATASACRASEAGPGSGLTPPPGWQQLPTVATAITEAVTRARGQAVALEAWGDPARGCYGAWLDLAGTPGTVDRLAQQLLASVTREPALAGISLREVVAPGAGARDEHGELSFSFALASHQGRVRVRIAKAGPLAAIACFWNAREPLACQAACRQLLEGAR